MDTILIEYKINNGNQIHIFGDDFVKNNENEFTFFVEDKEFDLISNYEIQDTDNNKLVIELKINKIKDISSMFHDCSSLLSISENFSKLDTNHIKDMNSIFYNCSSLEYLPDI